MPPKFSYLKRNSKKYEPKQIKWNVTRRVDCWATKKEAPKNEPKKKPLDLEEEVTHVTSNEYFDSRNSPFSCIPQFCSESFFITHYTNDIYSDMLEVLESHYTFLCDEDS